MKVTVFGCGYVGLVSGVCLAGVSAHVQMVDIDRKVVSNLKKGEIPFFEPDLLALLAASISAGKISFCATPTGAPDICMIAVGSPTASDGKADLSQVFSAIQAIGRLKLLPKAVVLKSTVPPGTAAKMDQLLYDLRPDWGGKVISNPEFLRQGNAVGDFLRPDRVVLGADDQHGHAMAGQLYHGFDWPDEIILRTTLESAEAIKYAANAFLTTKIAFMNELADYCETIGADIGDIATGMGLDQRIGPDFLQVGPGIGGSCFPKDIRALSFEARKTGNPLEIVDAVIKSNNTHLEAMVAKIRHLCGGSVSGLKITALGATFKANTDDSRNSPALDIILSLIAEGARVHLVDPQAKSIANASLVRENSAYTAAIGADAIVVLTEWADFKGLDLGRLAGLTKYPKLADLRNIYTRKAAEAAGFDYVSIGR